MIRILFLCDRHPCPPSNGLYVPFYELVKRLRCFSNLRVDLALPSTFESMRHPKMDSDVYFDHIYHMPIRRRSKLKLFFDLIFFKCPPYSIDMEIPAEFLEYDIVIATPDGFVKTLETIKHSFPATYILLCINELYSTVMLGQILNDFPRLIRKLPRFLYMGMKYFIIYLHEKSYLSRMDAIVVQSQRETERIASIRNKKWIARSFIFTNPMKQELLLHTVTNKAPIILIHAPRSPDEIQVLVQRVSTHIQQHQLTCVIRICVNNVQVYQDRFGAFYHVEIMGYQENILDVYCDVFCGIVMTRQRFGVVNRVKEGMTAGVAVIGYPETLRTVGPIEDRLNVICAQSEDEFVQITIDMINNPNLAAEIGVQARRFILDNETHSPEQFIQDLFSAIGKPLIKRNNPA